MRKARKIIIPVSQRLSDLPHVAKKPCFPSLILWGFPKPQTAAGTSRQMTCCHQADTQTIYLPKLAQMTEKLAA